MELKNKGTFSVIFDTYESKFVIVYNERGTVTTLSEFIFGDYDYAMDYVQNHIQELDDYVTNLKEEEQRKIEEEEAERKRKEEEELKAKEEKEKKKKKFIYDAKRIIAGFLAAVITLVGGHFLAKGISSSIKGDKSNKIETSAKEEETKLDISTDIENIADKDEELTQENFEKLTANFAKPYVDNSVDVTTEDLTKFVSIVNIDKLAEENPEFASKLFSTQTKEEYLNDSAKVIGATVMYNYQQYMKDGNTDNFIKVSEAAVGEGKEELIAIEEYTNKIAEASKNEDVELINQLVSEFTTEINSGNISKLDDGVGFAAQVNIALISDIFAAGYLNQENYDMLQKLKTSEKYVSNIFTVYEECASKETIEEEYSEMNVAEVDVSKVRTRKML